MDIDISDTDSFIGERASKVFEQLTGSFQSTEEKKL